MISRSLFGAIDPEQKRVEVGQRQLFVKENGKNTCDIKDPVEPATFERMGRDTDLMAENRTQSGASTVYEIICPLKKGIRS